ELPGGPRPRRRVRRDPGRPRRHLLGGEGADRQPDRQQRGGQDHHAAHDLGTAAAGVGHDHAGREADPHAAGARDPGPRGGAQPRGAAAVRADDGGGEPPPRRLHPLRRGGHRGGPRPGVLDVPGARGAAAQQGRAVLRRRAADARHRPGADVAADAAHARRAVHGPLADHDPADLRDGARAEGHRHDGAPGRAERAGGAGAVGRGARHRPRPHHAVRQRGRAAGRPAGAGGVPRRGRGRL
ncbi:MAG: Branched-chain amino acid transport ATP-binding protein LivF, partial [uncultured Pseudonocardia sp.]